MSAGEFDGGGFVCLHAMMTWMWSDAIVTESKACELKSEQQVEKSIHMRTHAEPDIASGREKAVELDQANAGAEPESTFLEGALKKAVDGLDHRIAEALAGATHLREEREAMEREIGAVSAVG